MKNLFLVQDSDRPMYVLSENWSGAIDLWKTFIASENDMEASDVEEPTGVQLVADKDDLIQ